MEEDEIIAGLLQGDPAALNDLMDTHVHTVYRLCSAILGRTSPKEDVEECTSDVFFLVWKSIGTEFEVNPVLFY
ncbi:RNA polymerase factor sigma-70 [Peptococcaceae bacterium CEB3]|nr:RNA polymerase factor sigma-70 [Peptococcaceae bacterium CEB3]